MAGAFWYPSGDERQRASQGRGSRHPAGRGDGAEALSARPPGALVQRVSRPLRHGARPLLARREPLRARRVRALRHDRGGLPVGEVHPLEALRPPLGRRDDPGPEAPPSRRARRAGAGPGGDPPRAVELRPRGAPEPARPPPRPEWLGQEHDRGLPDARDRELLDARRGGALPLQLGLPVEQDRPRVARVRAAERVAADEHLRPPRRRPDRREAPRRGPRPPALPLPRPRAARAPRQALRPARRARGEPPVRGASRRTTGSSAGSSRTRASRSSRRSSRATRARSPR